MAVYSRPDGSIKIVDSYTFMNPLREEWMHDAPCTQVDPEIFFPGKGGKRTKETGPGKICGGCGVKDQCLEYILKFEKGSAASDRYGFFGNKSPVERAAIAKERGLKNDVLSSTDGERKSEHDGSMEPLLSGEEEDDWGSL